jgi:hypothetical protein
MRIPLRCLAFASCLVAGAAPAQVIELDDEPPTPRAARPKPPAAKPAPRPAPKAEPAPKPEPKRKGGKAALPEGPTRGIPAVRTAPAADPSPAPAPSPVAPRGAESDSDDVEVFDGGETAAAPRASAPEPTKDDERFEVSGWVRFRASGMREDDERVPADPALAALTGDPSAEVLPYDRVTGDAQGYLRTRYRRGKRLEAVLAGSAAWSAFGNAEPTASAFAGLSESQPRSSFEAVLREGWLGIYRGAVDWRVGLQRIAWGRSDAFAVNDVVNARDVREPFTTETALQRLPTLAVRSDVALGSAATLQLHVAPFFAPDSFDLWGSNGAIVQPSAPAAFRYLLNRVGKLTDPTLRAEAMALIGQTQKPRLDFTEPSAGARLGWEAGGFDGALYAHYGFHTQPYVRVSPDLPAALATVDPSTVSGLTKPFLDAIERGQPLVLSTYVRRLHAGFDVSRALGPVVLKLEGAFDSRAPFLRTDFSAGLSPVAAGVLGLEWSPGDGNTFVLLESSAQQWLDLPPGAPLLFVRETTLSEAAVVRHTFAEKLELELRTVAVLDPLGYIVRPQIAWKEATWDVRVGAVWLDGDDGSYAKYYARNTQAFLIARGKF